MGTLMVHDQNENGQVGLAEGLVAGEKTPVRRYQQIGHFLHVDGPLHALAHDVEQISQLGYRLATAAEQNLFAKQQKKAETVTETGQPETPPALLPMTPSLPKGGNK